MPKEPGRRLRRQIKQPQNHLHGDEAADKVVIEALSLLAPRNTLTVTVHKGNNSDAPAIAPPEPSTSSDSVVQNSIPQALQELQTEVVHAEARGIITTENTNQSSPANVFEIPSESNTTASRATNSTHNVSDVDNNLSVYAHASVDPIVLFAESLQETLRVVRDAALSEADSRLGGRIQIAKELPIFSGNPLEWMHFEATYRSSTRLCQFTDRENISRLFKALRGQAREAVETLLGTATIAEPIIELLKLNFGNKRHVAERILRDIHDLPSLQSGRIDIARFATRLKNAICSLKSLGMPEYINSIDLLRSVTSKITEEKKVCLIATRQAISE